MSTPPTLPSRPSIPSGQELYDYVMGQIEPELTTEGVKAMREKYANETPEQKKERAERYNRAFAKYDEEYPKVVAQLEAGVRGYKFGIRKYVENQVRQKEEAHMSELETQILSL